MATREIDGEKLRVIRESNSLTQTALAKAIGVTRVTISRWETGAMRIERPDWLEMRLRQAKLLK